MKPLTPNTPHLIIMVGIPGSGKTTFAKHFAATFQTPYINPRDVSELTGIDDAATEKVTKLLFSELLKTRRTLIYEGSTYTHAQRAALESMVAKEGYSSLRVWVQTDPVEAKRRSTKQQPHAHVLTNKEFDVAFRQFENPSEKEKPVVISGKHTYPTQLKAVLKRLSVTTSRPALQPKPRPTSSISVRDGTTR